MYNPRPLYRPRSRAVVAVVSRLRPPSCWAQVVPPTQAAGRSPGRSCRRRRRANNPCYRRQKSKIYLLLGNDFANLFVGVRVLRSSETCERSSWATTSSRSSLLAYVCECWSFKGGKRPLCFLRREKLKNPEENANVCCSLKAAEIEDLLEGAEPGARTTPCAGRQSR